MPRCLQPVLIRSKAKDAPPGAVMEVPCNKCENCLSNKRQMWSYRLESEQRYSSLALFVGLSYSPEGELFYNYELAQSGYKLDDFDDEFQFVRGKKILLTPLDDVVKYSGFCPTVHPIELQRFFKRLRKYYKGNLRYFSIGEYGGKFFRPHYHFCAFLERNDREFFERCVLKAWPYGEIECDYLNSERINYVTKYMMKNGDESAPSDKEVPCFQLTSHNLGKRGFIADVDYYNKRYVRDGLFDDYSTYKFLLNNGNPSPPPRCWYKKYVDDSEFTYDKQLEIEKKHFKIKNDEFQSFKSNYFPDRDEMSKNVISSYLQATDNKQRSSARVRCQQRRKS